MSDIPRISRRSLFRGVGSATLVAGCAAKTPTPAPAPGLDPAAPPLAGTALGPGPAPLRFTLNGAPQTLEAAPSTTLLELLRHQLDATGSKLVCDRGACGACTVLVDGAPQPSCMTLAHDVEGRGVTTVEGLAANNQLSPLQRAFIEHDALQCGYCSSGMLMSCQALLNRRGATDAAAVEHAIAGNLCRCGTYPNVVAAVLSVAKGGA
ncbi:MAG: (2Fe-2S)-binding protein [Nannocystis sp.]|uniref:(2Fe-2S)-binding protein n=1 Tax=Nannocystis sp. TaxID=1962667 RepID=UPI0024228D54|nr:(2Fe-2S)-binding protein [Nannocystis sp.]MBK9756798.1 (2Fe-2S)-binding protein [Nannocystis sp.]